MTFSFSCVRVKLFDFKATFSKILTPNLSEREYYEVIHGQKRRF